MNNINEMELAIKDAALYDPRVYSFDITPESVNGLVTLRGEVDNLKAEKFAEKLAENAWEGGAWMVKNELIIE